MYDPTATRATLDPVVHGGVEGVCALLVFEGNSDAVEVEAADTLRLAREHGAKELSPRLSEDWWEHRYDFYDPPHHPELPAIWGRSTSFRATRRSATFTTRSSSQWRDDMRRSGSSCGPI